MIWKVPNPIGLNSTVFGCSVVSVGDSMKSMVV